MAFASNSITKTIKNEPITFTLNIDNYATMGNDFAMETFSPPESADVWQVKVTRGYFQRSPEDPIDPNLYLWFEIGFGLVSRADVKDSEAIKLFYKVDLTFDTCSWPSQRGHTALTKGKKSYTRKFWSKSFQRDDFYHKLADKALTFDLTLSYTPTEGQSSLLPKSNQTDLYLQTKATDNGLFAFSLKVNNYTSLGSEYAEEKFSPPGSLDVWYLRVYRVYFTRINTEENPTDLNLYPYGKIEFGLVSRADGKEESEILSVFYEIEINFHNFHWETISGIKGFKKETCFSDYYAISKLTKEEYLKNKTLSAESLSLVVRLGYTLTISQKPDIIERSLSNDLGEMANHVDTLKRDVILRGSDGQVEVSSFVLIARSEVFRTMLSVNMIEKTTGLINLPEFKCNLLDAFVRFLLTDKVDNLDNLAVDLFILGDKYQVTKLKAICEEHIAGQVNQQNAARILALIEMIPSAKIMARLFEMNKSNKIKFINE